MMCRCAPDYALFKRFQKWQKIVYKAIIAFNRTELVGLSYSLVSFIFALQEDWFKGTKAT